MRRLVLGVALLAGCAELGLSDGTSISVGRPSNGYLLGGVRLPERGDGFATREVWRARDNRFGTEELVDLLTAVAHRMRDHTRNVKLVVADLSGRGGGGGSPFHRSHQTGRDVDLLYYMRDASGKPVEPDAMHVFDATGRAVDGAGTIDVPRTWALVKELVTAPEATVQWVFMYEPIARRLLEHAQQLGEPEALIARARKALKQPGDSARHDDHLHVRVYCAATDRRYGCVDIGPMELLAEREAEPSQVAVLLAALSTASSMAAEPGAAAALGGGPGPGSLTVGAASPTAVAAASSAVIGTAGPAAARAVGAASAPAAAATALTPPAGGTVGPSMVGVVNTSIAGAAAAVAAQQRLGRLLRLRPSWFALRRWP
jgi:penicillin-insensitive murein endopeptidase